MKSIRRILLVALTLLFGLHILRVFLPTVIWYLGQYLGAYQLALYALGTFALVLLSPLVRRALGDDRALGISIGGVTLVRFLIQWVRSPLGDLALATAGLAFWGWFLVFWLTSWRNRPAGEIPALAAAFPIALIADTSSRTLLLSYDLAWRQSPGALVLVVGLVGLAVALLVGEMATHQPSAPSGERGFAETLPLIALGPWLYLAMAVAHNPAAWMGPTGWSDIPAHLVVNVLTALGALVSLWVAGRPSHGSFWGAMLNGAVLIGALVLFYLGIGPAWVPLSLSLVTMWLSLSWILGDKAPGTMRPGVWRTTLTIFLALLLMLVTLFLVSQFALTVVVPFNGALLAGAALWKACRAGGEVRPSLRLPLQTVGAVAAAMVIAVAGWAGASWANRPTPIELPLSSRPLRVMTYNIHQGIDADMRVDLEGIAAVIREQDPDVVALNEVNRARPTNGFVDTLLLLSRRTGMPYIFGNNSPDGQYGNAILSRYPIREWQNFHYTYNTTEIRGLLRVAVETPEGLVVFHATHLDHLAGPRNARTQQVTEALQIWRDAPRSVLLGDLNAEPYKPEISLIYRAGWVDALAVSGQTDVFTFWDPVPTPGRRIDYIFVTPDLKVERAWVVQTRASDHLPVLAEISLGK